MTAALPAPHSHHPHQVPFLGSRTVSSSSSSTASSTSTHLESLVVEGGEPRASSTNSSQWERRTMDGRPLAVRSTSYHSSAEAEKQQLSQVVPKEKEGGKMGADDKGPLLNSNQVNGGGKETAAAGGLLLSSTTAVHKPSSHPVATAGGEEGEKQVGPTSSFTSSASSVSEEDEERMNGQEEENDAAARVAAQQQGEEEKMQMDGDEEEEEETTATDDHQLQQQQEEEGLPPEEEEGAALAYRNDDDVMMNEEGDGGAIPAVVEEEGERPIKSAESSALPSPPSSTTSTNHEEASSNIVPSSSLPSSSLLPAPSTTITSTTSIPAPSSATTTAAAIPAKEDDKLPTTTTTSTNNNDHGHNNNNNTNDKKQTPTTTLCTPSPASSSAPPSLPLHNTNPAAATNDSEGLPPPTPPPTNQVFPCLRGKIIVHPGRHVCKGNWAMTQADHDREGGLTSRFEFSTNPPTDDAPAPANGTYAGFFFMMNAQGQPIKYEDQCQLEFVPNAAAGWNIKGRGGNKFGSYQLSGTVKSGARALELELFRLFDHILNPKGASSNKNKRSSSSGAGRSSSMRPPTAVRRSLSIGGGAALPTLPSRRNSISVINTPPAAREPAIPAVVPAVSRTPPVLTSVPSQASLGSTSGISPLSHLTEASGLGDAVLDSMGGGSNLGLTTRTGRARKTPLKHFIEEDDRVKLNGMMTKCFELLCRLLNHPAAIYFREPVDPILHQCVNYFEIIKEPMDLGTIKRHIETGHIVTPSDFAANVRLVFSNAVTYNSFTEHPVHIAAEALGSLFEEKYGGFFKETARTRSNDAATASAYQGTGHFSYPAPPRQSLGPQSTTSHISALAVPKEDDYYGDIGADSPYGHEDHEGMMDEEDLLGSSTSHQQQLPPPPTNTTAPITLAPPAAAKGGGKGGKDGKGGVAAAPKPLPPKREPSSRKRRRSALAAEKALGDFDDDDYDFSFDNDEMLSGGGSNSDFVFYGEGSTSESRAPAAKKRGGSTGRRVVRRGEGGRRSAPPAFSQQGSGAELNQALLARIEALEKQLQHGPSGGGGAGAVGGGAYPDFDASQPLSYDEKRNLRLSIENLPMDKANKIIKIIQDRTELGALDDEEVEIDIDKLDTGTLRELQRFVASCMASVKPPPGKRGPGRPRKEVETYSDDDDSDDDAMYG